MQTTAQVAAQNDLAGLQAAVGETYNDEGAFKDAAEALGATRCAV